jgi:protein-disulfide isomerase
MSESNKFELSPSLSILIAGMLIAGAVLFTNTRPAPLATAAADSPQAPTTQTNVRAPVASDHIIGSPNAPLVLIEYSDFQCPFCSLVYPTLKKIVQDSNGQIAWVLRNFPLESIHPNARPAALAAECVAQELGNNAYWKFADTIFADQSKMSSAYFEQVALTFGAQKAAYESCLTSAAVNQKVNAETAEAQQNGGQGTPYTILYDKRGQVGVSGALPAATFNAVIKAFEARQ